MCDSYETQEAVWVSVQIPASDGTSHYQTWAFCSCILPALREYFGEPHAEMLTPAPTEEKLEKIREGMSGAVRWFNDGTA